MKLSVVALLVIGVILGGINIEIGGICFIIAGLLAILNK